MPLVIEGGCVPPLWAKRNGLHSETSGEDFGSRCESVSIALVNNMPDAALEDTEAQFFELLEMAFGSISVRVKLYSLPGIPRADRGMEHLGRFYHDIADLLNSRFDAMIMAGTEPRQPNLRDEPYWPALANVLDWAERNTCSTVLSCLAAHAGVLHSDGITRRPLEDKLFGVFDCGRISDHLLTTCSPPVMRFPHSRWNEVPEVELRESGYSILTRSNEAGADVFVKEKGKSLFVHFQGHPEYEAMTLLKEYRRDVRRFLSHERDTYPKLPRGYFDEAATQLLTEFCRVALASPREDLMASFPDIASAGALQRTWHGSAASVYRNWSCCVLSRKARASCSAAVSSSVYRPVRSKRPIPSAVVSVT